MSEKLTRREESELDRRQRDLKRRLSSSDYPPAEPDSILLDIPADPVERESWRRPLLQSEKCLRGEHEPGNTVPFQSEHDGVLQLIRICKYCRCLYVEKA